MMAPESFKGGAHFVMGGLAATMLLYNVMRYGETKQARNLTNTCAYLLLFGLEWANCRHHWSRTC